MWLPRTHSLNRNAPVPTGLLPKSAPCFWLAAGDTMNPSRWPSMPSRPGNGCLRVKATVSGSTASTDFTTDSSPFLCGFHSRVEAAIDVPLDCSRVEGRAVLEFDALAQVQDHARAAGLDVPALGELRPDREIGVQPHQRIEDEIEDLPLGVFN